VAEKDILSVECSIDSLVHDGTETLQTKAAKLIHKVLGQSSDLTRFDQLRLQLKEQLQRGKCLISERDEYRKVIAKLHCHILSLKYRTRDTLKLMEKECIVKHGVTLDESNAEYKLLYKRLELVKRVLSVWVQFEF
jgi:hypothetical protein